MHVEQELVPIDINGRMVTLVRVVDWQNSYAFYLQGFSYAHVEAYEQFKQGKSS